MTRSAMYPHCLKSHRFGGNYVVIDTLPNVQHAVGRSFAAMQHLQPVGTVRLVGLYLLGGYDGIEADFKQLCGVRKLMVIDVRKDDQLVFLPVSYTHLR